MFANPANASLTISYAGAPAHDKYVLEAEALDSKSAKLNGVPLVLGEDGALPDLAAASVGGGAPVNVPPRAYGFVVFPGVVEPGCGSVAASGL